VGREFAGIFPGAYSVRGNERPSDGRPMLSLPVSKLTHKHINGILTAKFKLGVYRSGALRCMSASANVSLAVQWLGRGRWRL
jgi:hypothetical protein